MKNSTGTAAIFLKHMITSLLCSIRDKTNALKARLIVLSLLNDKKLSLGSIPQKIHAILAQKDHKKGGGGGHDDHDEAESKTIVLYNASEPSSASTHHRTQQQQQLGEGNSDQYYYYNCNYNYNELDAAADTNHCPDTTHSSLFEKEEEEEEDDLDLGDPNVSVIDLVRNSKEAAGGGEIHEEFKLEDEIDQVADLFILKFRKRMRLQKLESFKRYQDMLQRSA